MRGFEGQISEPLWEKASSTMRQVAGPEMGDSLPVSIPIIACKCLFLTHFAPVRPWAPVDAERHFILGLDIHSFLLPLPGTAGPQDGM